MRLKNVLIVVEDIERSKQFYHDLFGLDMVLDNDGNMILTEGLVLQDRKIWEKFLEKDIIPESNACELYFEERDIEAFAQKLEKIYPSVKYVNRLTTHSWGQKVIRFYDPDGNLIEVGTPHGERRWLAREGYEAEGEEPDDWKADGKLLLSNLDKLHTTQMGGDRIKKNLRLERADVVEYCRDKILASDCNIYKEGKNWYCQTDNITTLQVIRSLQPILLNNMDVRDMKRQD